MSWRLPRSWRTSSRRILVGPWRGEVGFEVLYWIPFVRWLRHQSKTDPGRWAAYSRGGAAHWYQMPSTLEILSYTSPEILRREAFRDVRAHRSLKQVDLSVFDRQLLVFAQQDHPVLADAHVIHPSRMFRALSGAWEGTAPVKVIADQTRFQKLSVLPLPAGVTLPPRFVAVKFYARHTFAMHPVLVKWTQRTIAQMAQREPVVILDTAPDIDDHALFLPPEGPNIVRLSQMVPAVEPGDNLALQSAVLARASRFVGTYGGFAQLALSLAIPSVSFFQHLNGTMPWHLELSQRLARSNNIPFIALQPIKDVGLLSAIFGGA